MVSPGITTKLQQLREVAQVRPFSISEVVHERGYVNTIWPHTLIYAPHDTLNNMIVPEKEGEYEIIDKKI